MTTIRISLVVLALLSCAVAAQQNAPDFASRRTAAEAAGGGHRAKLYVELARDEMEAADKAFTDGNVDAAQKLVQQAGADAQLSVDAALDSGKRLKETELALAKLQFRTRDIARSLAFEDRPPVEKMVQKIDELRQSLLDRMFGGKKKEK